MDLYILNRDFQKVDVIDDTISAIWTERYGDAGDLTLVVPANFETITSLSEGTFISCSDTREVMIVDTQSIEKEQLKVTGNTLIKFLNQRWLNTPVPWGPDVTMAVNLALNYIVQRTCTLPYVGGMGSLVPDGVLADIPNLTFDSAEEIEPFIDFAVNGGPIFDIVKELAGFYAIGIRLYLASTEDDTYELRFEAYSGRDRTSGQSENDIVRFSPLLDSLVNTKELRSITEYKTVAWAYPSTPIEGMEDVVGVAYADDLAHTLTGFDRRSLVVTTSDVTVDTIGGSEANLQAQLNRVARNTLANNNFIKIVDGEVLPQSEFQYGTHYSLGDIVELQSASGQTQAARITEYIRTQDVTGERAYPTVSIIE